MIFGAMLYNEGKLSGTKNISLEEQDELIEKVSEKFDKIVESSKGLKTKPTGAQLLNSVLFDLGITDSMNLIDDRTMDILLKYEFLKNDPTKINHKIWMDAVIMLNRLQPRLF